MNSITLKLEGKNGGVIAFQVAYHITPGTAAVVASCAALTEEGVLRNIVSSSRNTLEGAISEIRRELMEWDCRL